MNVFHSRSIVTLFMLLLLGGLVAPSFQTAEAQLVKRIKDRVKQDAERRVENRAVEAARRTLDLAEDAIVCAVTDKECIEDAREKGQEPVIVDEEGKPISGYEPAGTAAEDGESSQADNNAGGGDDEVGEGVWANYDFVPGERVIYAHDFEGTRTGNFPSRLDYIAGNLDVVELGDNKVLRVGEGTSEGGPGGNGCFTIPLPETLPERYTIEYRVRTSDPLLRASTYLFSDGSDDTPDTRCTYPPNPHVFVGRHEQGLQLPGGYGAAKAAGNVGFVQDEWMAVAIAVDGPYWKMYVNGTRVSNVPKYDFPRATKLHFFMNVYRYSLYVDDLRIAEGGPRSLYDDLMSEGFISTTAIRFDTGSATIKPESSGILSEMLAMLEEHDDLELIIEGHTDSQGADAANQTLSEQRAEAVAAYLIDQGTDASRFDTVGFGESQPTADNSTAEGMAMNRRVVFRQR